MSEIDYKKLYEQEKDKVSQYRIPSEVRGFYAYNRIINAQIDILEDFDLKTEIKKIKVDKEDKFYERVETMIEKLSTHLTKINTLKSELNLSGNEKKDKDNAPFIESVAIKRD